MATGRCTSAPTRTMQRAVKGSDAWRFNAATGAVTSSGLAAETDSPSWAVVHPSNRFLYAANELPPAEVGGPEGAVTAFANPSGIGEVYGDQPHEDQRPRASALDRWIRRASGPSSGTTARRMALKAPWWRCLPSAPTAGSRRTEGFRSVCRQAGRAGPGWRVPSALRAPLSLDGTLLFVAERAQRDDVLPVECVDRRARSRTIPRAVDATKERAALCRITFGKDGRFLYCDIRGRTGGFDVCV